MHEMFVHMRMVLVPPRLTTEHRVERGNAVHVCVRQIESACDELEGIVAQVAEFLLREMKRRHDDRLLRRIPLAQRRDLFLAVR
jgi:hypothetical protein